MLTTRFKNIIPTLRKFPDNVVESLRWEKCPILFVPPINNPLLTYILLPLEETQQMLLLGTPMQLAVTVVHRPILCTDLSDPIISATLCKLPTIDPPYLPMLFSPEEPKNTLLAIRTLNFGAAPVILPVGVKVRPLIATA